MEERWMMQEFKKVKRWEKQGEGGTSLNMKKTGKGEEKRKPKNEERSRQIQFIFSWKKKNQQDSVKREVEALRSNSIE